MQTKAAVGVHHLSMIAERVMPGETPRGVWEEHIARYAFAANFVRGQRVLDLGCGTGYGGALLQEAQPRRIIGADLELAALAVAGCQYGDAFDGLFCLDAQALPFHSGVYDTVVCFETIEHVPQPSRLLSEVARILTAGGRLICSTPNKRWSSPFSARPWNPYHVQEFSERAFRRLLMEAFSDVDLHYQRLFDPLLSLKNDVFHLWLQLLGRLPRGKAFQGGALAAALEGDLTERSGLSFEFGAAARVVDRCPPSMRPAYLIAVATKR